MHGPARFLSPAATPALGLPGGVVGALPEWRRFDSVREADLPPFGAIGV